MESKTNKQKPPQNWTQRYREQMAVIRGCESEGWRWGWGALPCHERETWMKTEHEIWCNGSGDLQPLLNWGTEATLSLAFIPNCRLQDFLWSYLSQDTMLTWSRSPCFYPRPFPSGLVSGTVSKCVGSVPAWCGPGVPRSMLSWSRSYSLLCLALGFVTRLLF